jgi:hypothetical protein
MIAFQHKLELIIVSESARKKFKNGFSRRRVKIASKNTPNTYLASLRIRFISPCTTHDSSIIEVKSFLMNCTG